jgi:soluble lytic murein transglycosylase-like protein
MVLLLALTAGFLVGDSGNGAPSEYSIVPTYVVSSTKVALPDTTLLDIVVAIELLCPTTSRKVARRYAKIINRESKRYGYDWRLLVAMIMVESSFDSTVVSSEGAVGLMQVRPPTGRYVAEELGMKYSTHLLADPATNIRLGTHYLSIMQKELGSVEGALQAYWLGPTTVRSRDSRRAYVDNVMGYYAKLRRI